MEYFRYFHLNSEKDVSDSSQQLRGVMMLSIIVVVLLWFAHLRQELLAGLVCFELVYVLHQDAFVLEHVTLCPQIQTVVPEGETQTLNIHFCIQNFTFTKLFLRRMDLAKSAIFTIAVLKYCNMVERHCIKLNERTNFCVKPICKQLKWISL